GKLEIGSVEEVGNKTGCLKGKCNNGSDNGIYVSQNRLVLGNTNTSIILIKKYSRELGINPAHWSNVYMGDVFGNLLEKTLAIKKGLKAIKTDKGWSTELQNIQDGVWTSYFSSVNKDL